jgi:hypothetical protein
VAHTNWLVNAKNLEELKTLYYSLARRHHPDVGGDTEIMQQINAEYRLRVKLFKAGFTTATADRPKAHRKASAPKNKGQAATEWERLNITREAWEAYRAVCEMREAERYPWGIVVKIVKGKVQVGGKATYYYRERLKALGFAWNSTARYWFYVKKPSASKAN